MIGSRYLESVSGLFTFENAGKKKQRNFYPCRRIRVPWSTTIKVQLKLFKQLRELPMRIRILPVRNKNNAVVVSRSLMNIYLYNRRVTLFTGIKFHQKYSEKSLTDRFGAWLYVNGQLYGAARFNDRSLVVVYS